MDTEEIILEYVCPSMGCIMAAAMCAGENNHYYSMLTYRYIICRDGWNNG